MAQIALQVDPAGSVNGDVTGVRVVSGLLPQVVAATLTTEPTSIDMQGYDALAIVLHAGVVTDGEYTVTVTDSADDITFVAVDCLASAFAVLTAAADELIQMRRVQEFTAAGAAVTVRRYVKCLVTESSAGTTGVPMSITFIAGSKRSDDGLITA